MRKPIEVAIVKGKSLELTTTQSPPYRGLGRSIAIAIPNADRPFSLLKSINNLLHDLIIGRL